MELGDIVAVRACNVMTKVEAGLGRGRIFLYFLLPLLPALLRDEVVNQV
jgi:hypothetical protein